MVDAVNAIRLRRELARANSWESTAAVARRFGVSRRTAFRAVQEPLAGEERRRARYHRCTCGALVKPVQQTEGERKEHACLRCALLPAA